MSRTDRWTDGRTTYDSNTALALRASRVKKGEIFIGPQCTRRQYIITATNAVTESSSNGSVFVHCQHHRFAACNIKLVELSYTLWVCLLFRGFNHG